MFIYIPTSHAKDIGTANAAVTFKEIQCSLSKYEMNTKMYFCSVIEIIIEISSHIELLYHNRNTMEKVHINIDLTYNSEEFFIKLFLRYCTMSFCTESCRGVIITVNCHDQVRI